LFQFNIAQISKLRTFIVLCGGMAVGSTVVHKVFTIRNGNEKCYMDCALTIALRS
jgi:hypothetical protein